MLLEKHWTQKHFSLSFLVSSMAGHHRPRRGGRDYDQSADREKQDERVVEVVVVLV